MSNKLAGKIFIESWDWENLPGYVDIEACEVFGIEEYLKMNQDFLSSSIPSVYFRDIYRVDVKIYSRLHKSEWIVVNVNFQLLTVTSKEIDKLPVEKECTFLVPPTSQEINFNWGPLVSLWGEYISICVRFTLANSGYKRASF